MEVGRPGGVSPIFQRDSSSVPHSTTFDSTQILVAAACVAPGSAGNISLILGSPRWLTSQETGDTWEPRWTHNLQKLPSFYPRPKGSGRMFLRGAPYGAIEAVEIFP